jgi:FkbM family methyltransferase
MRTTIERLSRGVVLRRRLPAEFGGGRIYVAPESGGLRFWRFDLRKTDPNLYRNVEELVIEGTSLWDIGANIGNFAFPSAYRAGSTGYVLAVEPDAENLRLLYRTRSELNSKRNAAMDILGCAVSCPGPRIASFSIARRSRSANSLEGFGGSQTGGVRETRKVPLFTLDELLHYFRPPQVLKIDVEGAEVALFAGAREILERVRPTILVEVEPSNSQEVGRILRDYRYKLTDADLPASRRQETESAAWNCLARPQ